MNTKQLETLKSAITTINNSNKIGQDEKQEVIDILLDALNDHSLVTIINK